jgi:hypothetical protein
MPLSFLLGYGKGRDHPGQTRTVPTLVTGTPYPIAPYWDWRHSSKTPRITPFNSVKRMIFPFYDHIFLRIPQLKPPLTIRLPDKDLKNRKLHWYSIVKIAYRPSAWPESKNHWACG